LNNFKTFSYSLKVIKEVIYLIFSKESFLREDPDLVSL